MTVINIWTDFACPDCNVGERRLLKAIDELNLRQTTVINYRACELRPSPSETFDAHRLMKLAAATAGRETIERLNFALFDARFEQHLPLSDHAVLLQAAEQAGLDPQQVTETLNDPDRYADQVRLDEAEARRIGVRGIPYMVFNDTFALPESLDIENMKSALQRAQTLSDQAHGPGWGNPRAVTPQEQADRPGWEAQRPGTCGPDGCKLY